MTVKKNLTGGNWISTTNNIEQSGFSSAVRAYQSKKFLFSKGKANII